jgi:hypothetical protein
MMYEMARELIGPDEADAFIKVPTPIDKLRSQAEENEGLINGEEIEVDKDDNDQQHLQDMQDLFERAMDKDSKMHFDVRRVVLQHAFQHGMQLKAKEAQKQALEQRRPTVSAPAEAGGEPSSESGKSSPPAGGMSNAMQDLADSPGGQKLIERIRTVEANETFKLRSKEMTPYHLGKIQGRLSAFALLTNPVPLDSSGIDEIRKRITLARNQIEADRRLVEN